MQQYRIRDVEFLDIAGIFATAYNFTANIDKAVNGFSKI